MKMIKTTKLADLINRAKSAGLNRTGPPDLVLDSAGKHLLTDPMIHGDGQCVRCFVYAKIPDSMEPTKFYLDVPIRDYNAISEFGS